MYMPENSLIYTYVVIINRILLANIYAAKLYLTSIITALQPALIPYSLIFSRVKIFKVE